jgi:hypothetical protein
VNLSQLLIEKNKEIETERRKSVHEFLSKEMDIDRLKQEIIERFSGQIERITFQCEHLISDFRLYLKKGERATLYQDNYEFKDYIGRDVESILNLSNMGTYNVKELKLVEYYDPFYQDIEIVLTIELLNEDF